MILLYEHQLFRYFLKRTSNAITKLKAEKRIYLIFCHRNGYSRNCHSLCSNSIDGFAKSYYWRIFRLRKIARKTWIAFVKRLARHSCVTSVNPFSCVRAEFYIFIWLYRGYKTAMNAVEIEPIPCTTAQPPFRVTSLSHKYFDEWKAHFFTFHLQFKSIFCNSFVINTHERYISILWVRISHFFPTKNIIRLTVI